MVNNIVWFLVGVFVGNIIDIKYISLIYIIYALIKNDPISDNIYPRTLLIQFIIWCNTKYTEFSFNNQSQELRVSQGIQEVRITEIKDTEQMTENKLKISNERVTERVNELAMIDFSSLPPPSILPLPSFRKKNH